MKKKLLYILFIGILLIGMTGCGSKEEQNENNTTETNNEKEVSGEAITTKVKVGDYVHYQAKAGSYTSKKEKNGSSDKTYEITGDEIWRVMYVNEDGSVDLIKVESLNFDDEISFYKGRGFLHYEEELDNLAKAYGNGDNVISAKNISYKDLIKYAGVDEFAAKNNVDLTGLTTTEEKIDKVVKAIDKVGEPIKITDQYSFYEIADNEDGYIENSDFSVTPNSGVGMTLTDWFDKTELDVLFGTEKYSYADFFISNKEIEVGESLYGTYAIYYVYTGYKNRTEDSIDLIRQDLYATNYHTESSYHALPKPVITLDKNTKIIDGDGTEDKPYELS